MDSGTTANEGRETLARESLEQLKTILFGEEKRRLDEGLAGVEARLDTALQELRSDLGARLDELGAELRARLDDLSAELDAVSSASAGREQMADLLVDLARRLREPGDGAAG